MNVKKVEISKEYNLLITYSNNEKKVFDTIQCDNGLEIAPEKLYDESVVYHTQTSAM